MLTKGAVELALRPSLRFKLLRTRYSTVWKSKPANNEMEFAQTNGVISAAPQINETFDFEHHVFKNGGHLDFFKIPKSSTEFSPEDMGIVIAKAAELSHLMFTREKKEFYSSMMNYLKYEHSHISKDQLIEWREHLEKSLIRGLAFYLFEASIGEEVHLESVLFHALPDRLHEVELMHREEMLEAIVSGFIGEYCQRFLPSKENKVEEDERNRMNYEEPTLL